MRATIVTDHGLEVVLPGFHRVVVFTASDDDAATIVTDHGLEVVLPGFHRVVVFTASDDDAATIAGMVRSCGCVTKPLTSTALDLTDVAQQEVSR